MPLSGASIVSLSTSVALPRRSETVSARRLVAKPNIAIMPAIEVKRFFRITLSPTNVELRRCDMGFALLPSLEERELYAALKGWKPDEAFSAVKFSWH